MTIDPDRTCTSADGQTGGGSGVTRRAGMLGLAAAVAAGGLDATVHANRRRKDRASDDPAAVTGPTGPVPPAPDGAGDPSAPGAEGGKKKRKGPTGPTGPTGQGGPAGPAGEAGPAGPGGPAGPAGPAGPTGPAGAGTVAGPNGAVQYNAGGVLGGTAGFAYNPGTSKLTVDGDVEVSTQINAAYLANAGSTLNALYYDPSGNLVAGISDASRKTNVETLADGAAVVGRLRPVRFDWAPEARLGDRRQIGLIAQEVRDVVPEVVGERGDGLLNVEYALLVAPLIGAVQELQRRVAELEAEVRALRSRGG